MNNWIWQNVKGIDASDYFLEFWHESMKDFVDDPTPALQLGIAIMLDKPIILAVLGDRKPPERLLKLADKVVYGDNPETIAEAITEALKEYATP